MIKYRATAENDKGQTFQFNFYNENWNGIEAAARLRLQTIVDENKLHRRNGPWTFRNIDRNA